MHLLGEISKTVEIGNRVLVTTLTKKLAEDLSSYLQKQNVRCRWLHSELNAFERVELLRDLRAGDFDVLVGVNLLREGIDLPEVSLVAILDADKEGFLRSETSLLQTIGRSARNVDARVILYADRITDSMQQAMNETQRRREIQSEYNDEHNITPTTIRKEIRLGIEAESQARDKAHSAVGNTEESAQKQAELLEQLEIDMLQAAAELDFERAANLRDQIGELRDGVPPGQVPRLAAVKVEEEKSRPKPNTKTKAIAHRTEEHAYHGHPETPQKCSWKKRNTTDSLSRMKSMMELPSISLQQSCTSRLTEPVLPDNPRARTTTSLGLFVFYEEASRETRHLISGLRPPALDELGIIDSHRNAGCRYSPGNQRRIHFRHNALQRKRLPTPLEVSLFRISQESLTNIRKHSKANQVRVELTQDGGRAQSSLTIQDDGCGFDCNEPEVKIVLVLKAFAKERSIMAASASIQSRPGNGTTVQIEFPASVTRSNSSL